MTSKESSQNANRQVELRNQGIDEDQAARIAGTARDKGSTRHEDGRAGVPKWSRKKNSKLEQRDESKPENLKIKKP